ncbi:MAG: prolyl oligopeptidase family serine peptidase [Planctomycetes bacterium]|nr:prolyl oligopeptidase family serine peptidase [Planctomycetota bacterium]
MTRATAPSAQPRRDCPVNTPIHLSRHGTWCLRFVLALITWGTVGRTHAADPVPLYAEHQDLSYVLDASGQKHPIQSVADWELRRQHVLAHMQSVMGPLPDRTKLAPLEIQVVEKVNLGNIVRRKIEYTTEPGYRLRAYLFIPAGLESRKVPGILCLHQTVTMGKDEPAGLGGNPNLHYALHLAGRGFVTLAPDYPSFGERPYDFAPQHGYLSGSMKAIWDNMRGIDLLQSLPDVDPDRIGCIGHSLGGHNTMFTAVFDTRIKALVSNCGFTRFHKYYEGKLVGWTSPRYMPRIANVHDNNPDKVPFDFTEIVAAFAPRAFLASSPVRDSNFEVSGVRDVIAAAKPIYALYGKPDNLQANYPESEHDFPAEAREVAYRFLEKHLK